jgi:alkaline phosphatase D
MMNPVVQVIDQETNELVYTIRINGTEFRPMVFKQAKYTIKVGEPGTDKVRTLADVPSLEPKELKTIDVEL